MEADFVPTAWVNQRCGGRVLGETEHRDVEGIAGTYTKPPNATCQRRADEFQRTPSECGRPGRIQGARAESSQVHASRAAARAPDPREASNPHFDKAIQRTTGWNAGSPICHNANDHRSAVSFSRCDVLEPMPWPAS
jgi:hypothetical protein